MVVLIAGVTGQDGALLAKQLVDAGVSVVGTTRDAASADRRRLVALGIDEQIKLVSMLPTDYRSVLHTLSQHAPNEVYFLAGQTSVGMSFDQPVEAIESIATGVLNILEAIRFLDPKIRFFNAGSSECFGDTRGEAADENTPFRPLSPYAVAKACAHNLVANYRIAYGLFACTGILFNHESTLRPERFVTQKIVRGARDIALGQLKQLRLGNLNVTRDWGWAPEYVSVMRMMLQRDEADDLIIATGKSVSLSYFVERAFRNFGLDWKDYVVTDSQFMRPSDIAYGAANPAALKSALGWSPQRGVDFVIDAMCDGARAANSASRMST